MKNNIDWKTKLSSRKFWVSLAGFVVPLLLAFGFSDNIATQVAAIIIGGGNIMSFVLGESYVDSSRIKSNASTTTTSTITTVKDNTLSSTINTKTIEGVNNG